MPKAHVLPGPLIYTRHSYFNAKHHTECVEFIKQTLHAPNTLAWTQGATIKRLKPGEIDPVPAGTAIATFVHGVYPPNGTGHAAIYLGQNLLDIQVLDQWDRKGEVTERTIYWTHGATSSPVDDPYAFSKVTW